MISSKISIHVPSWGTTDYRHTGSKDRKNFNPRSLVGNDAIDIKFYVPKIDFNPRSLVGNDEQAEARQWQHAISIHVPSWGTTACTSIETGVDLFQSTFPRGERRHRYQILRTKNRFQSTFPRGERQLHIESIFRLIHFNPRSLVGNDDQ